MADRKWQGLATVAVAVVICGCGSGNGLTMGRVSGLVTYKGTPVELGEVLFVPDSNKGTSGVPSMGPIGKDGRYIMSTQESGDGVIAGYHKVGIRALDPEPVTKDEAPQLDPETLSGRELMDAKRSLRTGKAPRQRKSQAKSDAPTVSFGGKTYRFLAPEKLAYPDQSGIKVQISRGSNQVSFAIEEDGTVKVSQ
jgi:hypothetical protein